MWIFWLLAAGLFFVIEIYTVGFFIFWFGIGSLLALLSSFFTDNIIIQSIIFLISSTILLFLTKPLVNKFVKSTKLKPTNVYSVIGKEGVVVENIDTLKSIGTVKVNGELWSATADENIEKDTKIRVVSVKGVKAKVIKI